MFFLTKTNILLPTCVLMTSLASPALAGDKAAPVVASFERFHGKADNAVVGGRLLLGELGCINCHRPEGPLASHIIFQQGPILDGAGERIQRSYMRKFLSDPSGVKPGTTMPNVFAGMAAEERAGKIEALVHFLAANPLRQEPFERKIVNAGKDLFHKVGCVACHGPRDERGRQVNTWAGLVPLGDLTAKYSLTSLRLLLENPLKSHPSGRMPGLLKAQEAKQVAHYLLQDQKKLDDNFIPEPKLAQQGRELFASMGCANCHQVHVEQKPLASRLIALPLAKLRLDAGCLNKQLAPDGARPVPHYPLSPAQRTTLIAALKAPAAFPAAESEAGIRKAVMRTFMAFNCYACHERDRIGGVQQPASPFFHTADEDLADEGRLPPTLTGVGAKLNPAYLKNVLDKGSHDRPYMYTRMPGYGDANVGHLIAMLPKIDKVPAVAAIDFKEAKKGVKADGRHMIGSQGLGCIKCHTFAGRRAEGIQGMDLTIMSARLRRDWFHQYLLNPAAYRELTRMPTAWPGGMSVLPKILDGDAAKQIEAIWEYLLDGRKARTPLGVGDSNIIPLTPVKEAIIFRNFLEGGGTRAIGVGYPERTNLAFDANDLRLAMLWQGPFINAGRHWSGRGEGFEPPLGDNVLHLPAGVSLAVLAKETDPWPTKSARELGTYRFRGYRLSDDQRPTFLYSVGEIMVEDFPNPGVGKYRVSVIRTLNLIGNTSNLYFRAISAAKIQALNDGWYHIGGDNGWKMRLESTMPPRIRTSGKVSELLVPVAFKDGKARIVQEFAW